MTTYCGVDFHARQQSISYCDTSDGELHYQELDHESDDVCAFYSQFTGEVIVGLEASGYSAWFEQLLEELGHQVWLGNAAEIRRRAKRRQKNDRRDAELILDLLLRGEFPRVHCSPPASRDVLRLLRYRHRLIQMRTQVKNSLRALALSAAMVKKGWLFGSRGRERLFSLPMTPAMSHQRDGWLSLLTDLNGRVARVDEQLKMAARGDERVLRLQTHPGIGLLTSLALVHSLEPVARFSGGRKVAAYVGLEPMEHSSAGKQRFLGISKGGSRLLRYLLVEAAHTAVKRDEGLKKFYQRLVYRRGAAKAKVAVARKLLVRGYIILRDCVDYQEFLRRGVEARPARLAT
jgi:transposase